jgi:hypothetical protein
MASDGDDIERLLREVDAALNPAPAARASGGKTPAELPPGTSPPAGGAVTRLRAGVPVAVAAGAVSGAVVGVVFGILPFVDGFSGALGAFLGAAGVSLAGRLRRRR